MTIVNLGDGLLSGDVSGECCFKLHVGRKWELEAKSS